jgi:membrane protein required for colicin V production
MNALDIILIVLAVVSLVYGLFKGLIIEIFTLLSLVLAFFCANMGYSYLAPEIKNQLGLPAFEQVAAYAAIFLVVMVGVTLLGHLMRRLMRLVKLGWLDRLAGGGLGLVKAAVAGAVLVTLLTAFLPAEAALLQDSQLAPPFRFLAAYMVELLPQDFLREYVPSSPTEDNETDREARNGAGGDPLNPVRATGVSQ